MCKFFSFVSKGDGKFLYFTKKDRELLIKDNKQNYNPNSHTSIVHKYISEDASTEDKCNKYEFFDGKFIIDQINTTDDSVKAEKWINKFVKTKKFINICLAVVTQNGLDVQYLSAEQRTPDVCMVAVKEDGYFIKFLNIYLKYHDFVIIFKLAVNNEKLIGMINFQVKLSIIYRTFYQISRLYLCN